MKMFEIVSSTTVVITDMLPRIPRGRESPRIFKLTYD
jgi:hypothetical protein